VHFISGLMAHKVPFLAAELSPDVDPFLVLRLFAAFLEKGEGALISKQKNKSGAFRPTSRKACPRTRSFLVGERPPKPSSHE